MWELARHLGVPPELIDKAPSADLEANQTDETDLGVTYRTADRILAQILLGYRDAQSVAAGAALPGTYPPDEATRAAYEGWRRNRPRA